MTPNISNGLMIKIKKHMIKKLTALKNKKEDANHQTNRLLLQTLKKDQEADQKRRLYQSYNNI